VVVAVVHAERHAEREGGLPSGKKNLRMKPVNKTLPILNIENDTKVIIIL
jgi:hypothetical protein